VLRGIIYDRYKFGLGNVVTFREQEGTRTRWTSVDGTEFIQRVHTRSIQLQREVLPSFPGS